jgi:phage N-6-adenine-methyltransferase
MSKSTDERATPLDLFKLLDDEFHFEIDLAATPENAKCDKYYDKLLNSAWRNDWTGVCFLNPPYSDIPSWLWRARQQTRLHDSTIVILLPNDSSTQYFHEYIWDKVKRDWRPGISIIFPDKRYKFGTHSNSAKFATLIVVMRNDMATRPSQAT